MSSDYRCIRHPQISDLSLAKCYLCGKQLGGVDKGGKRNQDHIIPDRFFSKNDPFRPKLPVHEKCNGQKSIEDQWFLKQLQLYASPDPRAGEEFSKMMDKALEEMSDAYIVGKKVPNYILAKNIFNKVSWGMEMIHGNESFIQLKISPRNTERFHEYVKKMCQGIFMRNIPSSMPSKPDLIMRQYADLELRGIASGFIDAIKGLMEASKSSLFSQYWGSRVYYTGSRVAETPNKGFLFVQFYSQYGILATFR